MSPTQGGPVYAIPFAEYHAGPLATPLRLLFLVVVLVLLIASANVAGLMLARSAVRSKEFAIQMALGARVPALVRQALVESLLLASIAVLIGMTAGPALGKLLIASLPARIARGFSIHVDAATVAFTAAIGLSASFIAGLGPVLRILRHGRQLRLNEGSRNNSKSAGMQRLHNAFVIGQVALACLLLSATGLFLTSLRQLQQVDLGFEPHNMLAAQVVYSGRDFKANPASQASFVDGVVNQLATRPGILAAAAVEPLPFDPDRVESSSFSIENRPTRPGESAYQSDESYATPGYLTVARMPLKSGRWFSSEDRAGTLPVVIIDETLAHKYWLNEDPIGKRLRTGDNKPWAEIIGVVGGIRSGFLDEQTGNGVRYYPFAQGRDLAVNFVVRSAGSLDDFRAAAKDAIAAVGPDQAISGVTSMGTIISNLLAGRRLIVYMLGAFAGFALLLAVLGIYGLNSYLTVQRTQEIGIRMALGAQRFDVMWLILSRSLAWIFLGLCIGLLMSFVAFAVLRHEFTAIGQDAILTLILTALPLFLAGMLASLIIACRAAFIDPVAAIQAE